MENTNIFFQDRTVPLVLGHRGIPLEHQESTLAGFERLIELGIPGAELDVLLTKDEQIIVFHDENAERLTGVNKRIDEMDWEEVKELRIQKQIDMGDGNCYEYDSEKPIPLLEQVLEACGDKLAINIELKANEIDKKKWKIGRKVGELVEKLKLTDSVIVTSFDFGMLRKLEKASSEVHSGFAYSEGMVDLIATSLKSHIKIKNKFLGKLLKKPLERAADAGARQLLKVICQSNLIGVVTNSSVTGIAQTLINEKIVSRFHEQNMLVGAFTLYPLDTREITDPTLDQDEVLKRLVEAKVDWIETDDPVKLMEKLNQN